ncbi:peptide-methionine (S)-S-oxide reductase MsrA [Acidaminobacter sp. JC074]|uniref:peptide-methionine (S)-S-oxide reductase MsrA n=1 Tax=Acidaminobacter sp. JC074 TaxID=2530199 RepID=UPI001F0DEDCD|nr:peptide-methionine (S)-S-oxide reductase MsrA [Acidaminobacter sp. JC074]
MKKAVFAGGCFWCIESDLIKLEGVIQVVSGYIGGTKASANYEAVCSGLTDHREAVLVTYDETLISYKELVEYFFTCIDPTNPYGQFADIGDQYKTAIYYSDEKEKETALKSKAELDQSGRFKDPVVTEILEISDFYQAEDYHQKYYEKNADHYKRYRIGSGREGFIQINWGDKR